MGGGNNREFGGARVVYGPAEYGKATNEASANPADYPAFDRSGMVKQIMNNLSASTGEQQAKSGAMSSKLGVGRSSGAVGQMEGIAADTENRKIAAQQQAALDTFKEQVGQQQFGQQMAADKFKTDLAMYEGEKARRRAALGPFGIFVS